MCVCVCVCFALSSSPPAPPAKRAASPHMDPEQTKRRPGALTEMSTAGFSAPQLVRIMHQALNDMGLTYGCAAA